MEMTVRNNTGSEKVHLLKRGLSSSGVDGVVVVNQHAVFLLLAGKFVETFAGCGGKGTRKETINYIALLFTYS